MSNEKRRKQTQNLVLGAILTALVIILQFMGAFIKFGPFSVSLVLLPIVLGAATCSTAISSWLGFVFGVVVLISGDAAPFWAIDVFGTILTVLVKGTACGLVAGLVYNSLKKFNRYVAVIASAIICPIVNTGVFLLGCSVFFLDEVSNWGIAEGFSSTIAYVFLGLVGANFLFELGTNVVLSPVIVRLINLFKKEEI
ncbi:MAG: ECF transporter S component [Clostridia bacterium]|nr:ECF transporter S component [Clostridia bacterium]